MKLDPELTPVLDRLGRLRPVAPPARLRARVRRLSMRPREGSDSVQVAVCCASCLGALGETVARCATCLAVQHPECFVALGVCGAPGCEGREVLRPVTRERRWRLLLGAAVGGLLTVAAYQARPAEAPLAFEPVSPSTPSVEVQEPVEPPAVQPEIEEPPSEPLPVDQPPAPPPAVDEPEPPPVESPAPTDEELGRLQPTLFVDQRAAASAQRGTTDAPYLTIAQAVRSARAGAVIGVRPGTYHEAVDLPEGVSLQGEPGAVIAGSVRVRSACAVQDLEITQGADSDRGVHGEHLDGLVLRRLRIRGLGERARSYEDRQTRALVGIDLHAARQVVIEGCRIEGLVDERGEVSVCGLRLVLSHAQVRNNVLRGLHERSRGSTYGMLVVRSRVSITNNLIAELSERDWGWTYGIHAVTSDVEIERNTVAEFSATSWGKLLGIAVGPDCRGWVRKNLVANLSPVSVIGIRGAGIDNPSPRVSVSENNVWHVVDYAGDRVPNYAGHRQGGNGQADPLFAGPDYAHDLAGVGRLPARAGADLVPFPSEADLRRELDSLLDRLGNEAESRAAKLELQLLFACLAPDARRAAAKAALEHDSPQARALVRLAWEGAPVKPRTFSKKALRKLRNQRFPTAPKVHDDALLRALRSSSEGYVYPTAALRPRTAEQLTLVACSLLRGESLITPTLVLCLEERRDEALRDLLKVRPARVEELYRLAKLLGFPRLVAAFEEFCDAHGRISANDLSSARFAELLEAVAEAVRED